ncbi:SGNH/GDSL hydrolase family protein [Gordonia sp. CPCC 206044]|uniref:SGNH/GDSL hydrolase family protein n=1 Tax=Gordonia sp. CPCC 206044 TaxID=3140793 RepID=UPI003AF3E389
MKPRVSARRLWASFITAGAVIACAPGAVASAAPQAIPVEYVNLGDSYSAGSGVLPTAPGTLPQCAQSNINYAHLIADRTAVRLTDVSCGGAKTDDFYRAQYPGLKPQLEALSPRTRLVTFMIGGNDGDIFGSTVAKCVAAAASSPGANAPCKQQYGNSIARQIRTETFPKLLRAYTAIRAHAPRARVAVVNYPWILPAKPQVCPDFPIAPGDVTYTHGIQATLNDAIRRAAAITRLTYVDAAAASIGHDSCKPKGVRWIEPLISDVQSVTVHPNALGEREMAAVTLRTLARR